MILAWLHDRVTRWSSNDLCCPRLDERLSNPVEVA